MNKRRNICSALTIDIEDKSNIQSFNQNFFITQVSFHEEVFEDENDDIIEEIDEISPND